MSQTTMRDFNIFSSKLIGYWFVHHTIGNENSGTMLPELLLFLFKTSKLTCILSAQPSNYFLMAYTCQRKQKQLKWLFCPFWDKLKLFFWWWSTVFRLDGTWKLSFTNSIPTLKCCRCPARQIYEVELGTHWKYLHPEVNFSLSWSFKIFRIKPQPLHFWRGQHAGFNWASTQYCTSMICWKKNHPWHLLRKLYNTYRKASAVLSSNTYLFTAFAYDHSPTLICLQQWFPHSSHTQQKPYREVMLFIKPFLALNLLSLHFSKLHMKSAPVFY